MPQCPDRLPLSEMGQQATIPAQTLGLRKSSSILTKRADPPAEDQLPRGDMPQATSSPCCSIARAARVHSAASVVPAAYVALTAAPATMGQE